MEQVEFDFKKIVNAGEVKEGDIFAIKTEYRLHPEQCVNFRKCFEEWFSGMKTLIIFFKVGESIEHISEEEMNKMGWYRRDDRAGS